MTTQHPLFESDELRSGIFYINVYRNVYDGEAAYFSGTPHRSYYGARITAGETCVYRIAVYFKEPSHDN